ncbi:MAG TPA: tryptophan synthase subunit alpha [Bryobacteraceae bacterium]|jgi:tryptophan synthase alpha chain|nr:tryptophan synthase subunit alpha [Bryobacteraceae bacterium]
MTRIGKLFETLKRQHRCGMIAYLTAGDPSPEVTPDLVAALERGGADLIELGVPFSDPIADGPVIQQAGDRAIAAGTTLAKVLEIASAIRKRSEIPLLLFTYLNPALRYGFERLAVDAKAAGIDGCLLTDVSVEEARDYVKVMREAGLDTVFLAAPTSTDERLKLVADYSSGFIYLVSRTGITGEQGTIADSALPLIERMRKHTKLPLAMGFGVSKPEHVAALAPHCEAVVIGSAIVRQIERDPSKLEYFMRDLARDTGKGAEAATIS